MGSWVGFLWQPHVPAGPHASPAIDELSVPKMQEDRPCPEPDSASWTSFCSAPANKACSQPTSPAARRGHVIPRAEGGRLSNFLPLLIGCSFFSYPLFSLVLLSLSFISCPLLLC